jgi:hypothetical protein
MLITMITNENIGQFFLTPSIALSSIVYILVTIPKIGYTLDSAYSNSCTYQIANIHIQGIAFFLFNLSLTVHFSRISQRSISLRSD